MTHEGRREGEDVDQLTGSIERLLRAGPIFYTDILREFSSASYRSIMLAWGRIRERHTLSRDEEGHYFLQTGAPPPTATARATRRVR